MSEVTRTPATGGPAFASNWGSGVTIRDYFAAAVVSGIVGGAELGQLCREDLPAVARGAYGLADAMMGARREQ